MLFLNNTIHFVFENLRKRKKTVIFGGFVRDSLLDQIPKDVDIATEMDFEEIKRLFPSSRERTTTSSIKIISFTKNGIDFEIISCPSGLNNHLKFPDLTINGLYFDGDCIHDTTKLGMTDLNNRIIRNSNLNNYIDKMNDSPYIWLKPFRILSTQDGWTIERNTMDFLTTHSSYFDKINQNILNIEAYRILNASHPINSLKGLAKAGIISDFITEPPSINYQHLIRQNNYHFLLTILALATDFSTVNDFANNFNLPILLKDKYHELFRFYNSSEAPTDFLMKNEYLLLHRLFQIKNNP